MFALFAEKRCKLVRMHSLFSFIIFRPSLLRSNAILGAKKLPCNHIFHVSCLRSWFQRHQTCPTCRLNVLRPAPETQTTNHGVPPPQPQPVPPHNAGVPPLFAFPAWQPPFMPPPPMPHMNLGQANAPSKFSHL